MSLCVLLNQSFIAQIQHPIIQIIENPIAKKASNQINSFLLLHLLTQFHLLFE